MAASLDHSRLVTTLEGGGVERSAIAATKLFKIIRLKRSYFKRPSDSSIHILSPHCMLLRFYLFPVARVTEGKCLCGIVIGSVNLMI